MSLRAAATVTPPACYCCGADHLQLQICTHGCETPVCERCLLEHGYDVDRRARLEQERLEEARVLREARTAKR